MLFRRRSKPSLVERLKESFWPRAGWPRALRYFGKRILRLSGSPHTIAIGFAAGVFVAWSPLFGFHYLLAVACAFIVRGNVLAAVLEHHARQSADAPRRCGRSPTRSASSSSAIIISADAAAPLGRSARMSRLPPCGRS